MLKSIHARIYFREEQWLLIWPVSVKSIQIHILHILWITTRESISRQVSFVWKSHSENKHRIIFLSEGVMFHVNMYSSLISMSFIFCQGQYPPISGCRVILENHRYFRCATERIKNGRSRTACLAWWWFCNISVKTQVTRSINECNVSQLFYAYSVNHRCCNTGTIGRTMQSRRLFKINELSRDNYASF